MILARSSILDPVAKSAKEVAQDKSIRARRTRDSNGDQGFSRVIAADGVTRGMGQIAVTMGDYARLGFGTICTHAGDLRSRMANDHCSDACGRHGSQ